MHYHDAISSTLVEWVDYYAVEDITAMLFIGQ
jgi:hypothetical protein